MYFVQLAAHVVALNTAHQSTLHHVGCDVNVKSVHVPRLSQVLYDHGVTSQLQLLHVDVIFEHVLGHVTELLLYDSHFSP